MITWIKEVNNFQIPKAQPRDVASLLLDMTISAWGYLKSVAYKTSAYFWKIFPFLKQVTKKVSCKPLLKI